jgi:hypothetical protein
MLTKPWNLYVFRHSALTEKSQILTESTLRDHAGWTMTSKMPTVYVHGPSLLKQYQNYIDLSRVLVSKWLREYMFADRKDANKNAKAIANYLSDHKQFKTHSRHISRDEAKAKGLIIDDLETDQDFQDLVVSVFHATTHTFSATGVVKIIENHMGRAFIKQLSPTIVSSSPQPAGQIPLPSR